MLPKDAKWVDVIRCMCADETHHRDVNHTYANLKPGELNPYVEEHRKDAATAWRMRESGERSCQNVDQLALLTIVSGRGRRSRESCLENVMTDCCAVIHLNVLQ